MRTAYLAIPNQPNTLALDLIQLNEQNPRILKDARFKQLVASLEAFPEMLRLRPLVLDETNTVLGGNMRTRAKSHLLALSAKAKDKRIGQLLIERAEKEGYSLEGPELGQYRGLLEELFNSPEVPVVYAPPLSESQKREFIIKDNASFGEWDWDMLANGEWPEAATLNDWGLDVPKDWDTEPTILGEIGLPSGEAPAFKTMSFVLSTDQAHDVETALALVKDKYPEALEETGNDNANGNALHYLVTNFLSQFNTDEDDDASDENRD